MWTTITAAVAGLTQRGHGRRVDGEGGRVAVGEPQPAARGEHRGRGGVEGVGRDDHLATVDPDRSQDDLEGARAGGDGDRVGRAVAGGELLLEAFADGAEGETTGAQGLVDHAEDLGAILVREPDRGGWDV